MIFLPAILTVLNNVNIRLIAQGSSERQVAVVVDANDASRALRAAQRKNPRIRWASMATHGALRRQIRHVDALSRLTHAILVNSPG